MEVWDNKRCRQVYGSVAPGGITDHMLCAGKKGKDSCSVRRNSSQSLLKVKASGIATNS